jgi:hypothetical protein
MNGVRVLEVAEHEGHLPDPGDRAGTPKPKGEGAEARVNDPR